EPEEAGTAGADVPKPRRLRTHPRRRPHQPGQAGGDGAWQAGGVPYQSRRRDHRDAVAFSLLRGVSVGVVPGRLGPEPVARLLTGSKRDSIRTGVRAMTWEKTIPVSELTGRPRVFKRPPRQVALFLVSERVFAVDNRCPHEGYPLAEGKVDGTC